MKLLLVQLSDMHCHRDDNKLAKKMDKAADVLSSFDRVDKAVLIFSGDLSDTANKSQFRAGSILLNKLAANLNRRLNCGYVDVFAVPGNHDMFLPEDSRTAVEINKWNKQNHLEEELAKLDSFFEFSKTIKCFESDRLVDVKTIAIGRQKARFTLINSAPYSTREPDDKLIHYLPAYVGEKVAQSEPDDILRVAVCHHSYEWFDWDSKEMLKKAFAQNDIVFIGHDHKSETVSMVNGNGNSINVVMGGQFILDCGNESAFNAVIFDSETATAQQYELNWDITDELFVKRERGTINCKHEKFGPSKDYLNRLLEDNKQPDTSLIDYFVLPKLIAEGEMFSTDGRAKEIGTDDIFGVLAEEKIIRITGTNGAGKTSLLKYLYAESIERGYLPLLIEKKDYRDSRIEKMLKDMVDVQYAFGGDHGYDIYEQKAHEKEIIFIDDIDLIESKKARDNLIDYIVNSGRLLVYSTKDKNQDLEEVVKDRLQGKNCTSLEITPFYKESRDALIENICNIKQKGNADKELVITSLDYLVQCQAGFFSLTPGDLLQYINYFLSAGANESKGVKTLSIVFETNIRNAILTQVSGENIVVTLALLEFIADQMYFTLQKEKINLTTFEDIVGEFNKKRKANINAKVFLEICKKAHILKEEDTAFEIRFTDKNTFAYFVAKYINREYERDATNLEKLSYVMDRICFGINDTIILFLAFIRNNVNIILHIAEQSMALLEKYPEWDFDENNIPFLLVSSEMKSHVPTQKEKKEVKENTEQVEKVRHDSVKFRGIFDYSDEDVNKEKYRVLRALKFTQLVGRALVDQYGALDAHEIDLITETLYSTTQKIIYATLIPYQEHCEEIEESLYNFATKELHEKTTREQIKKLLGQAGTILALDVMNDIAFNASNKSTITALRDVPVKNSNYAIMQLMMEENTGNTSEFISRAIALKEEKENNSYAKMLIAQIARKHIVYTPSIDYRQIDRLVSKKVISEQGKKPLLIEQGTKKRT